VAKVLRKEQEEESQPSSPEPQQKEKRLRYLVERFGENKGKRLFQREKTSK